MAPLDELNRMAVQGLLADAERVLALTDLEAMRTESDIVDHAIANAQQNYIDLARRRRPLIMREAEETQFQTAMDCIMARIRFFGKTV
jgi:hypothetical protein